MILEQITLEGFLSYKKRQTVKFDDDSLIYLVNGLINNDSSLSNGAGKSSLFDILAGIENSDSGALSIKRDIKIAYLRQSPVLDESNRIIDELF
jgi:ABC-type Mn2+/Zn2+ transport system ATPase subunit